MSYWNQIVAFCLENRFVIINILLVFLLALVYSIVELLALQISIRSLLKTFWGWFYLLINGLLGILALVFSFSSELESGFLGVKILLAGTSALALLRVLALPIKQEGVDNRTISMIEIILNHVKREYDRQRSNFDLKDIKEIMQNVDYDKAADCLPLLTNSLLHTLRPEDAKNLNIDIQKMLSLEEGKSIKHLILGAILAKYIGIKLLRNTVNEIREFISIENSTDIKGISETKTTQDDLNTLIKKYI